MKSMKSIISKISVAVISASIAAPVTAGLIYTWESESGTNATGQIEFADYVHLGDIADPYNDIISKSFSFLDGSDTVTLTDNFFIPEYEAEVSSLGLCVPSCTDPDPGTKKKATKKKPAIKTKGPAVIMYGSYNYDTLWEWYSNIPVGDSGEFYGGTGHWNLASVPEPVTVLLFLSGLVSFSIFRKKILSRN